MSPRNFIDRGGRRLKNPPWLHSLLKKFQQKKKWGRRMDHRLERGAGVLLFLMVKIPPQAYAGLLLRIKLVDSLVSYRRRLIFPILLFFTAVTTLCALPAMAATVTLVVSENAGVYLDAALAIRKQVTADNAVSDVRTVSAQEVSAQPNLLAGSAVIVPIGLRAAHAVSERHNTASVVCALIPKLAFDQLGSARHSQSERRWTAVYHDQPASRQFDLIRAALPTRKEIGVVLGSSSETLLWEMEIESRERGLRLTHERIAETSNLFSALQRVLSTASVLLAVADPVVLNATTAQNTLLTSYWYQVPVVAFSDSYVTAGALIAVFSKPGQQAAHVAEIVLEQLADGGRLPPPAYPKYYTVRVNPQVARVLGIVLDDDATIARRMEGQK
jgi:putative tryptophan/tyrosine transport system substrate-binding protein